MNKIIKIAAIAVGVLVFVFQGYTNAEDLSDQVSGYIKQRLETAETPRQDFCENCRPFESKSLPKFYQRRDFRSAWSNGHNLSLQIEPFLEIIQRSGCEGLRPEDYHYDQIRTMMSDFREKLISGETIDNVKLADFDILLTDTFLLYVSHLTNGRINHKIAYPGLVVNKDSLDLAAVLQDVLNSGEIEKKLAGLAPQYPVYAWLKKELIRHQQIADNGGWPKIPAGTKMKKGSRDKRVRILRQRLIVSNDLSLTAASESNTFDHDLEAAVRKFQNRHGLKADGSVGRGTLAALNVPVEARIRQIVLNMERFRWLSADSGKRYVIVNIADYSLGVIENEQVVMTMKIIVGKTEQRSCILSGKMTYLELNPFWNVPESIATKEILPSIKKDPEYLAKNNIKVFSYSKGRAKEINPKNVNWSRINAGNLKYNFRQEPGPANSLGRIKFMFPNECEVYLHDTPTRHLFGRFRRAFSHGCIRIEKPIDLATYLLQKKDTWPKDKILAEIHKGKRQVVMLPDPIDVHIFYGTAWVDQYGDINFRDDIYQIDETPYGVSACRSAEAR
jgi:L,D-transpeptidase YcbB